MSKYTAIFATLFLVILSSQIVSAHLEGGVDVSDGKNVVDIGYDAANLTSSRSTVFLLSLHTVDGIEINSTSAWVKIDGDKGSVFTARLFPEPTGAYSFTTIFPEEGKYKLTARFSTKNGEVENSVDLNVNKANSISASDILFIKIVIESIIVLFLFFIFINNLRKNEKINGGKK